MKVLETHEVAQVDGACRDDEMESASRDFNVPASIELRRFAHRSDLNYSPFW